MKIIGRALTQKEADKIDSLMDFADRIISVEALPFTGLRTGKRKPFDRFKVVYEKDGKEYVTKISAGLGRTRYKEWE